MKNFYYYIRRSESIKHDYTFSIQEQSNGYFNIGVAKCSAKDNFCKSKGRLIADGRASKKPTLILPPTDKVVSELKEWILNNNFVK